MDILNDMGVSKLSANNFFFFRVNTPLKLQKTYKQDKRTDYDFHVTGRTI